MKIISALSTAALVFLLFACSNEPQPPNILFCFADDWGYYASCFADPEVPGVNDCLHTPAMDRLAEEGVSFNHAYVTVPSCTPSRAAVATGCYFWRAGESAMMGARGDWEGVDDPRKELPGFGTLLQDRGYHLGRTYKTLNSLWFPGKVYQDNGREFCDYSQTVEAAPSLEEGHEMLKQEVLANFQDFLQDREEGQPFCYVWGPHNPHRPWNNGSGKNIWGIEPDCLKGKMPGHLPDVPVLREDFADYLGEVQAFDRGVEYLVEELKRLGEYENTIIVLSGDNGIPGFPKGKANLYDFGVRAPLIIRWGDIKYTGRKLDDFVNLIDLAPTFLEAAGVEVPETMDGKSLLPLLMSKKEGLINKERDHAIVGIERHGYREGNLPYPVRAIHTKDFIYIHNFKPDRSPIGFDDRNFKPEHLPARIDGSQFSIESQMTYEYLEDYANQRRCIVLSGMDNGPAKAWFVTNRNTPEYAKYYEMGFGLRPQEELYDLRKDPDQLNNVAEDNEYAEVKAKLSKQLMQVLENTNDPRLTDAFDFPPYMLSAER
jgi:uncharacterized sulfatase